MTALHNPIAMKGRVTLSIDQTERMFSDIAETRESLAWVERNVEALLAHGSDIARTGLAGAEFDRI